MDLLRGLDPEVLGGGTSGSAPSNEASPRAPAPGASPPQLVSDARVRTYEELEGAAGRAVYFRPERFSAADLAPLCGTVSVAHGGELRECALRDVSQSGAAFDWPADHPLRRNEPLRVALRFDGHEMWRGDARVSSVRDGNELVGISFENALIDVEAILHMKEIRLGLAEGTLRANPDASQRLEQDRFKALVSDYRMFLEDSAAALARLEQLLPWHVLQDANAVARQSLVRRLRAEFVGEVLRFTAEIDAALRSAGPGDPQLRRYSQRQLDALVMQAPWMHRARFKPLGYPGDYEVMNFFYERDFEGPTLFARAIGYAYIQTPVAQAVCRRKDLVRRQLRALLDRRGSSVKPVRLLSIAAGPARELQELLAEIDDLQAPLEIVLFEQDKNALAHAYRRLRPLADSRFPGRVRITFLNASITRLLRDKHLFDDLHGFDAVYSCGLFDYLHEATAVRLTRQLYGAAAPGGRVLIANMVEHGSMWFMGHHLDWSLLYRTREELAGLARRACPDAQLRILEEETGVNPFVELTRA